MFIYEIVCWESALSRLHIATSEQGLLGNPLPQIPLPGEHAAQQGGRTKTETPDDDGWCEKNKNNKEKYMDH